LTEFKGIYIAYIYQKRDKRHCTKHQAMYLLSAAHKLEMGNPICRAV